MENRAKVLLDKIERKRHDNPKYQERSKQVLIDNIKKCMKTAMIGGLSSLEDVLGHLWGHGKDEADLTDKEKRFKKEVWEPLREEILDKGNHQIRKAVYEISSYTISKNRFQYNMLVSRKD